MKILENVLNQDMSAFKGDIMKYQSMYTPHSNNEDKDFPTGGKLILSF